MRSPAPPDARVPHPAFVQQCRADGARRATGGSASLSRTSPRGFLPRAGERTAGPRLAPGAARPHQGPPQRVRRDDAVACTTPASATRAINRPRRSTEVAFPAGSSWLVFTDQVLHAALGGEFALEQTFHLDVAADGGAGARAHPGAGAIGWAGAGIKPPRLRGIPMNRGTATVSSPPRPGTSRTATAASTEASAAMTKVPGSDHVTSRPASAEPSGPPDMFRLIETESTRPSSAGSV